MPLIRYLWANALKICTLILQPCYIPQYSKNFASNPIWRSRKLKREPLLLTINTQPYISRLCEIREKPLGLQIYNFLCTNRPGRNGKIKFVLCISSNTHFYLWSLDGISSGRGVQSNCTWVQTCFGVRWWPLPHLNKIHYQQKIWTIWKALWKHWYFTFRFAGNGLAPNTNKYFDINAFLTCTVMDEKCYFNLQN